MATKIKVLSEQTINQIAAGEVIESPASCVKELIENSLDAKALHLEIEIVAGGFSLIKISDDGEGMAPDDAMLSLERHATSKIRSSEDLFHLTTMGFRGEALASIASISKLHLLTARAQDSFATSIYVEGGKCIKVEKGSRRQGTTFEIRSLFYTTPARKKFQKNPTQAAADIYKAVTFVALSRPDVSITFISNHELIFKIQAETFEKRIEHLLGASFLKDMKSFEKNMEWMHIKGKLSLPGYDRPNRLGQYVFINKRPVIAPQISMAIQEAYGTMLTPRRFPLFVLDIYLRPDLIDVNVHPQKKEIRFKEETAIKHLLREEISKHLNGVTFEQAPIKPLCFSALDTSSFKVEYPVKEIKSFAVKELLLAKNPEPLLFEMPVAPAVADLSFIGMFKHYALVDAALCKGMFECDYLQKPEHGFLMVDLSGISKRLYFEKAFKRQDKSLYLEQLLFPLKIQLNPKEGAALQENVGLLENLGIKISPFGNNIFIVEALDKSLDEEKVENFIREFLAEEKYSAALKEKQEKLALKACQTLCRKKGYTLEMARLLITKFLQLKLSFYTPEGKKIIGWMHEGIYGKCF
jgi:DNA mismatch repair protein MutL